MIIVPRPEIMALNHLNNKYNYIPAEDSLSSPGDVITVDWPASGAVDGAEGCDVTAIVPVVTPTCYLEPVTLSQQTGTIAQYSRDCRDIAETFCNGVHGSAMVRASCSGSALFTSIQYSGLLGNEHSCQGW